MSKISKALGTIQHIDDLNNRDRWMNRLHPLVKFFVVLIYIGFTMAVNRYNLQLILILAVVPFVLFVLADLSVLDTLRRFKIILPLILLVGVINLIIDKEPYILGNVVVRAGVVSMITLSLKGLYAVIMSFVFIATTSIDKFCRALRQIRLPKVMVIQIMLTYRYIGLLLEESERVTTAYSLRAPGQNGVQFKVWGSLAGQMLLRCFDRSEEIYESMKLRGFDLK